MTTATKERRRKSKRRATFTGKKRKLIAKKIAAESTLRVVPTTARGIDDDRAWLD